MAWKDLGTPETGMFRYGLLYTFPHIIMDMGGSKSPYTISYYEINDSDHILNGIYARHKSLQA